MTVTIITLMFISMAIHFELQILAFFKPGDFGLAVTHLSAEMFLSNLYSQLGHSAWELQALQLIVLVVFGAMD